MSDASGKPSGKLNVAVGGPQGVGKSTALAVVSRQRPDFRVISIGNRLPEGFRSMTARDRERIRAEASSEVCAELAQNDGVTLVDLHYLDLNESEPRIQPPTLLALLDLRIMLIASSELLHHRRRGDPFRSDRSLDLADARRDVEAHLAYAVDELTQGGTAVIIDTAPSVDLVAANLGAQIDRWLEAPRSERVNWSAG